MSLNDLQRDIETVVDVFLPRYGPYDLPVEFLAAPSPPVDVDLLIAGVDSDDVHPAAVKQALLYQAKATTCPRRTTCRT